jgi:hypothetical protein
MDSTERNDLMGGKATEQCGGPPASVLTGRPHPIPASRRAQELHGKLDWTRMTSVENSSIKRVRGAHLTANARAQNTSTLQAS